MQASIPAAALPDPLVCVERFKLAVDRMLVQVEEYRKRGLMGVQLLGLAREKALEAQTDLLDVSAGQLKACVALGRAAVASGDDGRVYEAVQTAKDVKGLLAVPTWLCTGTRSAVVCDLSATLACMEGATRLERFEMDATRCSVSGEGLTTYANDGAARNVIRVTCMDRDGKLADWATLEGADVGMTVNGAALQVASAGFTEPGVVEVMYVLEGEGREEVEVSVSLRGVTVPGGPWRPRAGFMAKGVHIATLPPMPADYTGLAISSDGSLMVACDSEADQLEIFRTEDGSHVRSLGGRGTGPGEFCYPLGLCMTPHNTVLVAEYSNTRIQEVTLEGAHVKFIPLNLPPYRVAVHGDVMAVCFGMSIVLHSYTTGLPVRILPRVGNVGGSMKLSPDGEHLAVAGIGISLMSVDGQTVKYISPQESFCNLAFTCKGDVLSISQGVAKVFSATDGTLLRSWATANVEEDVADGDVKHIFVCAVSGKRLYVLEHGRVQVYE